MLIHVPQSKITERALLDAFHMQLDYAGCLQTAASLRVGDDTEPPPGAEASSSSPTWLDEKTRTIKRGVANVESISRSGIKVHISGMNVDHYHQNPVVLACHRSVSDALLPGAIGTIEHVTKTEGQTTLRFRNLRFDEDAVAEAWFKKIVQGTVRMLSVGFMPLEWELASETVGSGKNKKEVTFIDIPQSELLEISVVPIGANRGAFVGQTSMTHLLERIAAAEQRAAELQQAITAYLHLESEHAAAQAKERLLAALKEVPH